MQTNSNPETATGRKIAVDTHVEAENLFSHVAAMFSMARFNTGAVLAGALILVTSLVFLAQNYHVIRRPDHRFDPRPFGPGQGAFLVDSASLPFNSGQTAKVAKVSVIYGEVNEYYDAAIQSHQRHASRHGYPFHTLRHPVAQGYWNKAEYLHALLVMELAKPVGERMKWLMWVDADSAIINPLLPVEIFLPPEDFHEIHFLGNKDQNGLNTGIFFIRVHQWSVKMFIKTLGYPLFKTDVDLGFSADQTAMALIFNETENQRHVLYQPRTWYNAYQFHHGYEGSPGNLLVHFPGLEEDRWNQMGGWLQTLNNPKSAVKWEVPYEETHYPGEIAAFWELIRSGRRLIDLGNAKIAEQVKEGKVKEDQVANLTLSAAMRDLEFSLTFETDQPGRGDGDVAMKTWLPSLALLTCLVGAAWGTEAQLRCAGMYSQKAWGGPTESFILVKFVKDEEPGDSDPVVSLIIFEWQDRVLIGQRHPNAAPDAEVEVICSQGNVDAGLCQQDDIGSFILGSNWTLARNPFFTQAVHLSDPPAIKYPIRRTGYYCISTFAFSNHDYQAVVAFRNSYGELPGTQIAKLPFYGGLTITYAVLGVFWAFLYIQNRSDILPVQNYITATLIFLVVEQLITWGFYDYQNRHGDNALNKALLVLVSILNAGRNSLSFFLLLIVCMGYGVVKPTLGRTMIYVRILAIVHFAFGVIYAIASLSLTPDSVGPVVLFVILPLAATLTAFYVWTLSSLNLTMKDLINRKQKTKALMYKRLWCVAFAGSSEENFVPKHWQTRWFVLDGWLNIVYLFDIAFVAYLWRPTANNRRFAMSDELAQDDDGFEIRSIHSRDSLDDLSDINDVEASAAKAAEERGESASGGGASNPTGATRPADRKKWMLRKTEQYYTRVRYLSKARGFFAKHVSDLQTPAALIDQIKADEGEGVKSICIIENISPAFILELGAAWGIDPVFFADHVASPAREQLWEHKTWKDADLFLVDPPVYVGCDMASRHDQLSNISLRFPYTENRGGLLIPQPPSREQSLGGTLGAMLQGHPWHMDLIFSHTTLFPGIPFLYLMACSSIETDLDALEKEIREISFFGIRRPDWKATDRLHELRRQLSVLRMNISETEHYEPTSIEAFFHDLINRLPPNKQTYRSRCTPQERLRKLLQQAQQLHSFTLETFDILVGTMAVLDSKESRRQTEASLKQTRQANLLTSLAVVYLPLSLATSAFGMNLQEMTRSGPHVWVFVVTTIVLVSCTMSVICVLFYKDIDCQSKDGVHEVRRRRLCSDCLIRYVQSKVFKRMESFRFRKSMTDEAAATPGMKKRLLLPLSGGVSSLALLHVLDVQLARQLEKQNRTAYELVLVHVDIDGRLEQDLAKLGLVRAAGQGDRELYGAMMAAASTATARSDLAQVLLKRLVVCLAKQHNCASILWGHSDSRLAALVLADVAKGRGGSVPTTLSDGPSPAGVGFKYPMRDLYKAEIELYASVLPQGLSKKYASVMANVVRTASKLQVAEMDDEPTLCVLCWSEASAAQAERKKAHGEWFLATMEYMHAR
ncbi:hypothetical protein DV737_g4686, partial [Chaetothyriales sp. CBS 132003]